MAIVINPITSRLGISRFWVVNFLPTISSNYTTLEIYKYQNYIETLEKFFHLFFHNSVRQAFYTRLYIIYSSFRFNTIGFPGPASSKITNHFFKLEMLFYDFRLHMLHTLDLRVKLKRDLRPLLEKALKSFFFNQRALNRIQGKNPKKIKASFTSRQWSTQLMIKYSSQITSFVSLLKQYTIVLILMKQHFKKFFIKFLSFLSIFFFKIRLIRIHSYFFNNIKLQCVFRIVPVTNYLSAKFIGLFIERRIRGGLFVPKAISLVYRFLQSLNSIRGLRIMCAGRFIRGSKAGFTNYLRGECTFGSLDVLDKQYSIDYHEQILLLRTGICALRIWLCQWSRSASHSSGNKFTHALYRPIISGKHNLNLPYGRKYETNRNSSINPLNK